jgi:uncharacterized protein
MAARIRVLGWTVVALLGCSPLAFARSEAAADDPRVLSSQGFLGAHPDLKWRLEGQNAFDKGDGELALTYFKRAAKFADKPAQGMIAEMLWSGELVAQDRAAAYAWMDLAAERAFRPMLIRREKFWASLDAAERERALEVGRGLYAEYGDDVAQPRMERKLRSERRKMTGSRTGFVGSLQIVIPTLSGDVTIDGSSYYHPDYWQPERYWAWQEKGWKDPPRGVVDVGPIGTSASKPTDPKD